MSSILELTTVKISALYLDPRDSPDISKIWIFYLDTTLVIFEQDGLTPEGPLKDQLDPFFKSGAMRVKWVKRPLLTPFLESRHEVGGLMGQKTHFTPFAKDPV